MPTINKAGAFDYDTLPADIAVEARTAADRIRSHGKQQNEAIIAIGRELAAVKQKLEHGQFSAWLAAEFKMTAQTARNYMRVAETFGGENENAVFGLPTTALYLLASEKTPELVRNHVVERAKRGERITTAGLRKEISRVVVLPSRSKRRATPDPKSLGRRIVASDATFHLCESAGIANHGPIVEAAIDTPAIGEDVGAAVAEAIRANVAGVVVITAATSVEVAAADIIARFGYAKTLELLRTAAAMPAAAAA